jgi:glycosyltransferase involved in cell wall biosynthesis
MEEFASAHGEAHNNGSAAASHGLPRLAVVGPFPPPYGGWAHVVCSFLRPPFSEAFRLVAFDSGFGPQSPAGRVGRLVKACSSVSSFARFVRKHQPEAVLVFVGPGMSMWRDLVLLQICHRHRLPVYVRFFGGVIIKIIEDLPLPLRTLWLRNLRRSKAILVETHEMANLAKLLLGSHQVFRIPNHIHKGDFTQTCQSLPNDLHVLYLGSMTPSKGVEVILDCLQKVSKSVRVHAHFVGGELRKGYLEEFRRKVLKVWCAERITIYGSVAHEKALEIARRCHIFAFPTRWNGEGQPGALVEAMASGLVPIVTNWRGCAEIVEDGVNGFVLDRAEPEALARCIETLDRDRLLLSKLGHEARETIMRHYEATPALTQFKAVIEQTWLNKEYKQKTL